MYAAEEDRALRLRLLRVLASTLNTERLRFLLAEDTLDTCAALGRRRVGRV
jgi:hypothetical protein